MNVSTMSLGLLNYENISRELAPVFSTLGVEGDVDISGTLACGAISATISQLGDFSIANLSCSFIQAESVVTSYFSVDQFLINGISCATGAFDMISAGLGAIASLSSTNVSCNTVAASVVAVPQLNASAVSATSVSTAVAAISSLSVGALAIPSLNLSGLSVGAISVGISNISSLSAGVVSCGIVYASTGNSGTANANVVSAGIVNVSSLAVSAFAQISQLSVGQINVSSHTAPIDIVSTALISTGNVANLSAGYLTAGSISVTNISAAVLQASQLYIQTNASAGTMRMTTQGGHIFIQNNSTTYFTPLSHAADASTMLTLTNNGFLGVGLGNTAPSFPLDVSGSCILRGVNTNTGLQYYASDVSGTIKFVDFLVPSTTTGFSGPPQSLQRYAYPAAGGTTLVETVAIMNNTPYGAVSSMMVGDVCFYNNVQVGKSLLVSTSVSAASLQVSTVNVAVLSCSSAGVSSITAATVSTSALQVSTVNNVAATYQFISTATPAVTANTVVQTFTAQANYIMEGAVTGQVSWIAGTPAASDKIYISFVGGSSSDPDQVQTVIFPKTYDDLGLTNAWFALHGCFQTAGAASQATLEIDSLVDVAGNYALNVYSGYCRSLVPQ